MTVPPVAATMRTRSTAGPRAREGATAAANLDTLPDSVPGPVPHDAEATEAEGTAEEGADTHVPTKQKTRTLFPSSREEGERQPSLG